MGIKFRYLFGCPALFSFTILALLVTSAYSALGDTGFGYGGNPQPPTGFLKVNVNAPTNIYSAIQWYIWQGGYDSYWMNNGDVVADPNGSYNITFGWVRGWTLPATQPVYLPVNSTNTFSGSCSFVSLDGDFQGLFSEASGPRFESCGFCEISGGKSQSFTGKILCAGNRYSFSGKFDNNGNAWNTIARPGTSPLSVHLIAGEDILTGEISDAAWTATILAKRNTFDSKHNPAPQAGKYTFAFVSGTNSPVEPLGDSFGTMTIDQSGGVTLGLSFSDGTKASEKTFLGKDEQWPFYVSLYAGKGFAFGWIQLHEPSEPPPPQVELYSSCNYAGAPVAVGPGDYDEYELWGLGLYDWENPTNDSGDIRSLKVPSAFTVTLYTNGDFLSTPFTETTDNPCLLDDGIGTIAALIVTTNAVTNQVVPLPDFGSVTWMKPADARTKYYPAGFTNQLQTFLSTYQSAIAPASTFSNSVGNVVFQIGNSSQCITNGFSIDSSGKFSGQNKLNLTIATSGSFKGSVVNPFTGKPISFSGVVLQKQQSFRGFFLDGSQSGDVYFGP